MKTQTVTIGNYSVDIIKDEHGYYFKTAEGEDWYDVLKDAIVACKASMKYIISGKFYKDIEADKRYAQQERHACGNF
jgi:hypothetical protein